MDFNLLIGLAWLLSSKVEGCSVVLESVDCTHSGNTNMVYTCQSHSKEGECLCFFENPIQSNLGWHKMCKMKTYLKSRTKKVRKRQTELIEQCGAIQPPRPGKASCIISAGEIICKGSCDRGFRFYDGDKEKFYSCHYLEGVWKPNASFPICEPECIPPCQNGGNCTSPNFCSCSNEFRGDNCQHGIDSCELSKTVHASTWHCNHTRAETTCDISCHAPGSIETETDVQRHLCSVDGLWTPDLPFCVQVLKRCKDPGKIEFGRYLPQSSEYPLASNITYECNEGYIILGDSIINCLSTGQWSSAKPQCVQKENVSEQCPKPNVPKNSFVYLNMPDKRPLQSLWNSDSHLLQRLSIMLKSTASQESENDFSRVPEELFLVGTRVQYKCKSRFYKLYGSEYQTCLSSRTWSGYQPACVPECGKSDSPKTPFVVNGNVSLVGQWPWMVGLAMKGPKGLQLICGAVLVSESWVLTAAHCVTEKHSDTAMDTGDLLMFCGKYYRKFPLDDEYVQIKQVKQIIIHPEYDSIHFDVDIALIELERAVELTTRVRPICLPTDVTTRENVRDGQKGIVIGWGLTENGTFSETLRETVLPVVSHDKCEEAYREGLRTITITSNMFCAGHASGFTDTCNGDSGGPFMFSVGLSNDKRWYLEGLVSWGSESGCAKTNRYSGFTKVGRFVPWINMFI